MDPSQEKSRNLTVIILESEMKVKVGSELDLVMYSLNGSIWEAEADRAL